MGSCPKGQELFIYENWGNKMKNRFDWKAYANIARRAAAESCVLLRNENETLPLKQEEKIAVFGRSQFNYYKSGTGSGGMVNTAYVTDILSALKNEESLTLDEEVLEAYESWLKDHPFDTGAGWAQEPWYQEEMELPESFAVEAAKRNDAALIVIGRTSGEDKDNSETEGSWFLTQTERDLLRKVCAAFSRTIVLLNVGNIIDMKWVDEFQPSAVMYVWQGGQEGGNGVADVLMGRISPCGKLPDTIAGSISDYPSSANYGNDRQNRYEEDIYVGYRYFETFSRDCVKYPFGFGLSYTDFALRIGLKAAEREILASALVINTGNHSGKEVVQIYLEKPQGKLGQPARQLVAFAKTKTLRPDEDEKLLIHIPLESLASFDDSGITGHPNAWVMEEGEYTFYAGTDVRSARRAGALRIAETFVVQQCEEALAPEISFQRIRPVMEVKITEPGPFDEQPLKEEIFTRSEEMVPTRTVAPADRRAERIPEELPYTGDTGIRLTDVAKGEALLPDFIAQLSDEDLCAIVRGEGMCSPKVTPGTAGAFGGVTKHLEEMGVPVGCCSDGPSGIRMDSGAIAFAMPSGTALASTFDTALMEELYAFESMELRRDRIETLLGPGINLHRHPLNGRNFEYFSEDPLLTGKMASAQLKGMARYGTTGTIKHFACNNQEKNRNNIEALVSARALREIYLKGFEIAVKEGGARSIMTTYNPLNGERNASSYDLLTTILRKEWGFEGIVMTDWWAKVGPMEEDSRQDTAAMICAQNDLYMVTSDAGSNAMGDNSMEALRDGRLTRAELQRSAANICRFLLSTPAMLRKRGILTVLDYELEQSLEAADLAGMAGHAVPVPESGELDPSQVDTSRGSICVFEVSVSSCRGSEFFRPSDNRHYHLLMKVRAAKGTPELAQIPVTVYKDRDIAGTISLSGRDLEWKDVDIQLPDSVVVNAFQVKLFFGDGGMEIGEIAIRQMEGSMV